ncbi:MAG TPA: FadR/GntR family transcriptional regulator [Bryocella sp.]|nr:FadR/GntR family transcriptional regulator [Bryocella sp.]
MAHTLHIDFEVVRRQKVYEAVAEQIERLILRKLKPGDKLPSERELAEMLRVSRSSIRDAIRSLELLGLVEPRQGAGTIVRETSVDSMKPFADALKQRQEMVTDLLDFREMVEPPLAARAAAHISSAQISGLEDILLRQEQKMLAGEPAIAEDAEFHYIIALASGNTVVLKVIDLVIDLLRDTRQRALQVPGRAQRSLNGHRRILDAIARRDPEAASAAMRRHIREIEHVVMKKFERGGEDSSRK